MCLFLLSFLATSFIFELCGCGCIFLVYLELLFLMSFFIYVFFPYLLKTKLSLDNIFICVHKHFPGLQSCIYFVCIFPILFSVEISWKGFSTCMAHLR